MPSFAAFWLVVLQLLAFAAPRAIAPRALAGVSTTASLHRDDGRASTETPRPSADGAGLVASRMPGGARLSGGTALATRAIDFAGETTPVCVVAPIASHAVAARGGLLPYFPTAPPRVG